MEEMQKATNSEFNEFLDFLNEAIENHPETEMYRDMARNDARSGNIKRYTEPYNPSKFK